LRRGDAGGGEVDARHLRTQAGKREGIEAEMALQVKDFLAPHVPDLRRDQGVEDRLAGPEVRELTISAPLHVNLDHLLPVGEVGRLDVGRGVLGHDRCVLLSTWAL
jgi:hypothetical protein